MLTMRLLTFTAAIFWCFCSFSTLAQEKHEALPHPQTLVDLQKAMKDVLDKNHVPGAGIALISRGELVWCGGLGKADIAANREIACDTEFRAGSISKTFVALALLKLEEEGKINLNARLQDVAPEVPLQNQWESANPVRIINLLEHTAGFDDMSFSETYNTRGPADMPILNVLQAHPRPQVVRWPPSTRFSYSNPAYGVAGYLIEKISGQPFDVYIRKNILTPLGIDHGDFQLTAANRSLLAQGYQNNPPRPVAYKNIYLRPAGDMKASPGELAKLVQFFLRRGVTAESALIKPETIARMEYPSTPLSSKNGLRLGYGLANYTEVSGGVVTHGHDGGIDGFISTYRYMPEQNWGYVILLNSGKSGSALRDLNLLAIDFLSREFPKPYQVTATLSPKDLRKFAGFYTQRAPRSQLFSFMDELLGGVRIRVQNGHLTRAGLFDKAEILLPVGKNLFRAEKEPEATAAFFPNPGGTMCFVSLGESAVPYSEKSSLAVACGRLALLAVCAFLMASSLLVALLWFFLWIFRGFKRRNHSSVRLLPILAVVSLLAAFFGFMKALDHFSIAGGWSALVFAATILFPIFSIAGLWRAVRVPRPEIHRATRIYSFLVGLACSIVAAFLASWHLIALRLWAP